MRIPSRNARTGLALFAVVIGMVALAFASAPLYRLFCQVTGFGGTPQRIEAEAVPTEALSDRIVTIRFKQGLWGWLHQRLGWELFPTRRTVSFEPPSSSSASRSAAGCAPAAVARADKPR